MNDLRLFVWLTVLTGLIYPLFITGIAHLTMKHQASGNFLTAQGKVIGAKLIAQKFESNRYFWGRPSAIDYNPLPSGGSNLGPISATLKKNVADRKALLITTFGQTTQPIPSELIFSSGSGLDPHISKETALFQLKKVIQARGWNETVAEPAILKMISDLMENKFYEFLGRPYLNVLELNLALDELERSNNIKQ